MPHNAASITMLLPRQKLLLAVVPLGGVLAIGTIGYHLIGDWGWFDSLYFTVITVFGIGYGEHDPMSDAARYFTVGLVILGFSTIAYAISIIVQAVVESQLVGIVGRRRMNKEIQQLSNHYIVCGAGRMGARVIREMQRRGAPFVVIDSDEERIAGLRAKNVLAVPGDATSEEMLREAGVARAAGIVCAVASDADNLFITLNARDMNHDILIVARANEESTVTRLKRAGANKIVSPIITGAHQMAQMVLRPAVADVIDLATMTTNLELAIEQVEVGAGSPLSGSSLGKSAICTRHDIVVLALKRANGSMLFNPSPTTVVETRDVLVVVGAPANLEAVEGAVNPGKTSPARSGVAVSSG
jgi:voltage-gated potassium channel